MRLHPLYAGMVKGLQPIPEVMRCLRAFHEAGIEDALAQAVRYCEATGCMPEWVSDGLKDAGVKYLDGKTRTKKVAGVGPKRLKTLEADFVRWLLVKHCNENGMTIDAACAWLQTNFKSRTLSGQSESTFSRSYERVNSALKTERGAARYYVMAKKRRFLIPSLPFPDSKSKSD